MVKAAIDAELADAHAAAVEVARSVRQPQHAQAALQLLQQIRTAHARGKAQALASTRAQSGASSPGANAQQAAVAAAVAAVSKAGKAASTKSDDADDDDVAIEALALSTARDEEARVELEKMRIAAQIRDWQRLRTVQTSVQNSGLKRLLACSLNSAGMLQAELRDRHFVESLTAVKRALDDMAVEGVRGGGGSAIKSAVLKTQIGYMRTGRFASVRCANLTAKEDVKKGNALAFLTSVKKAMGPSAIDFSGEINDPAVVFREATARMASAYLMYHPNNHEASTFFDALTTKVLEANTKGLSWKIIGDVFWTPVMARLDHEFDVYRRSDTNAPKLSSQWLREGPEAEELREAVLLAKSEKAGQRGASSKYTGGQYRQRRSAQAGAAHTPAQAPAAAGDSKRGKGKKRKRRGSAKSGDEQPEDDADGENTQEAHASRLYIA